MPNLSPKPYPNPSTHPGEVSKGEWGDAWEGFVSEARGVWFTVRSARDDGQRFIEKMRRFWGLRCLAKHRAELSSCIPASPFVAKLMSAVSDGGEDQGAEEAIGAKRESFSSVLEPSPVRAALLSARSEGTHGMGCISVRRGWFSVKGLRARAIYVYLPRAHSHLSRVLTSQSAATPTALEPPSAPLAPLRSVRRPAP